MPQSFDSFSEALRLYPVAFHLRDMIVVVSISNINFIIALVLLL